jgi:hypothetical protein
MPGDDESDLPPRYAAWMRQVRELDGPIVASDWPRESRATCLDCAMCEPNAQEEAFDPVTKCCTYVPYLPSFLVGAILADDSVPPSAASALRARIAAGDAVTPLGVGRTLPERALYDRPGFAFGRERTVRCPYQVDGGMCGVWKHRNSVCSTWFCKHVRGGTGRRFWVLVHLLLERVEAALARHCAVELGIDGAALAKLLSPLVERAVPRVVDGSGPAAYGDDAPDVWGDWEWRVEAYFLACAEIVRPLAWRDVVAIGGSEVRMAERAVRDAFARMVAGTSSGEMPERLVPAALRVRAIDAELDRVWTYSPYDSLDLPRALTSALHVFADRSVPEALEELGARGVAADEALVSKLVDFEVLVPAERLTRSARRRAARAAQDRDDT